MKAFAVYRIYDGANQALYVGRSMNPTARLNDHTHTEWWRDARRIEITLHATGGRMVEMERFEIENLDPVHNIKRGDQ